MILITPELVAPLAENQVPAGGPGTYTTFPTDRELYFDGFIEVPNYGDACFGCGQYGACDSGCQSSMGGGVISKPFAIPVQEQTIPLSQADSKRNIKALMSERSGNSGRNGFIKPSNANRTASTIPLRGAGGGARPVGFVRPSVATQTSSGLRRTGTPSKTGTTQLPGLIEP